MNANNFQDFVPLYCGEGHPSLIIIPFYSIALFLLVGAFLSVFNAKSLTKDAIFSFHDLMFNIMRAGVIVATVSTIFMLYEYDYSPFFFVTGISIFFMTYFLDRSKKHSGGYMAVSIDIFKLLLITIITSLIFAVGVFSSSFLDGGITLFVSTMAIICFLPAFLAFFYRKKIRENSYANFIKHLLIVCLCSLFFGISLEILQFNAERLDFNYD